MDEEILVSKAFLEQLYGVLDKFDYGLQGDDGDTAELKAELSLDWFYFTKNRLENLLNENS